MLLQKVLNILLFQIVIILFVGCSNSLELPHLNEASPHPVETILFRDHFTATDLKEMISALNEKGKLNSIQKLVHETSTENLEFLTQIFSHFIYEEAELNHGFVSLLQKRIDQKGFANWDTRLLKPLIQFSKIFDLIENDIKLLHPLVYYFSQSLHLDKSSQHYYLEMTNNPDALKNEAYTFLRTHQNKLEKLAPLLQSKHLARNLYSSLSDLRKERGASSFNGVALSIHRHPKEWNDLLKLAHLLDQPSNGFFTTLESGIRKAPDLGKELNALLKPYLLTDFAKELENNLEQETEKDFWNSLQRKTPTEPPTANFKTLFQLIRENISHTLPTQLEKEDLYYFQKELFLKSYFLTRWFELRNSQPIEVSTHQGTTLSDLKILGNGEWDSFLQKLEGDSKITFSTEATTLEKAILDLDSTLSFSDSSFLLGVFLKKIPFEKLEFQSKESILLAINKILPGIGDINQIQIPKLSSEVKELIAGLFAENESHQKRCLEILNILDSISTFQNSEEKLPSLLSTYQSILAHTPPSEMLPIGNTLSFLYLSKLFNASETPYPEISRVLSNGKIISDILFLYSFFEEEVLSFIPPFPLNLQLLVEKKEILDQILDKGLDLLPRMDNLSSPERLLVIRFVQSEDFYHLKQFLLKNPSSQESIKWIAELKTLSRQGTLIETFHLLKLAQNSRMKKLATTLLNWEKSGQFFEFLTTIETLLKP